MHSITFLYKDVENSCAPIFFLALLFLCMWHIFRVLVKYTLRIMCRTTVAENLSKILLSLLFVFTVFLCVTLCSQQI